MYGLSVMSIPPNAPSQRKDHGPRLFFAKQCLVDSDTDRECVGPVQRDEQGRKLRSGPFVWYDDSGSGPGRWRLRPLRTKFGQLISEIHKSYERGQPVLVGTSTVEESSEVYDLLLSCHHVASRKLQPAFKNEHLRILNATPELAAKEASIIAEVHTSTRICSSRQPSPVHLSLKTKHSSLSQHCP